MTTFWPSTPPPAHSGRAPGIAWWSQRARDPATLRPLAVAGEAAELEPDLVRQAHQMMLTTPPPDRRVVVNLNDTTVAPAREVARG